MRRNTTKRWGSVSIGLHWTIAGLILLVQVPAGIVMTSVDPGPVQNIGYTLHKNVGIIVFVLAVIRLWWRWSNPVPALPDDMPRWQSRAARASHTLLYLLLFLMPITGYLYTAAGNYPVPLFGLVDLEPLVPDNKPFAEAMKLAHLTLKWVLLAVVAAHVAGALQHHLVRNDDVLRRMVSSSRPIG
jgi:cytochrome b561